jgi:hypothetical protein
MQGKKAVLDLELPFSLGANVRQYIVLEKQLTLMRLGHLPQAARRIDVEITHICYMHSQHLPR